MVKRLVNYQIDLTNNEHRRQSRVTQTALDKKKRNLPRALLPQKNVSPRACLFLHSHSSEMKRCRQSSLAFRFGIDVVSSPFSRIFSWIILHTLNKPLASQSENIGRLTDEIRRYSFEQYVKRIVRRERLANIIPIRWFFDNKQMKTVHFIKSFLFT